MQVLQDVKNSFRAYVGRYPALFYPLYGMRPITRRLGVKRNTQLVIEGFPRSANSFAVTAFESAQRRPVRIAHHLHVPAQVIRGVAWGLPTLVLMRNPVDAVLSLILREPYRSPEQCFREYVAFYRSIESLRDCFVVGEFREVTGNLGRVIERLNDAFGTAYFPFEHSPENVAQVFRTLERLEMEDGAVKELAVARPSVERERRKEALRRRFEAPRLAALIAEATGIYERLTGGKEATLQVAESGE
ncbi:hypothetical protein [Rhodocaloribacter sp.]